MDIKLNTKIIIGDSRKMDKLKDNSVNLIITSPPYFNAKEYSKDYSGKDLGNINDYELWKKEIKSVCNLFKDEGMLILETLLQNNFRNIKDVAHYKGHLLVEHNFNFFEDKRLKKLHNGFIFTRESFLEAYLLRNRNILINLSGYQNQNTALDVYNQIGTYIAGGNIDVVTLIKERLLNNEFIIGANVIELKNEPLEVDNLHQLKEYIEWTQRILPRCKKEMIHGILIGPKFGDKSNQRKEAFNSELKHFAEFYNINALEYFITSNFEFKYEPIN